MSAPGQTTDRYGRQLACLDLPGGQGVGRTLIAEGLAVARYDSLDGYPYPRQAAYRALDTQTRNIGE